MNEVFKHDFAAILSDMFVNKMIDFVELLLIENNVVISFYFY